MACCLEIIDYYVQLPQQLLPTQGGREQVNGASAARAWQRHNKTCQPSAPTSPTTLQPTNLFTTAAAPPVKTVGAGVLAVATYDALDTLFPMPPTGLQRVYERSEVI